MLISFLIYIFPLLSPILPSTSMHASTPLPSPSKGCPTLFYPPFPYSHYPSSPLHYHRIPPLKPAPLRSTLLPSPTQLSHTLSYPSLAPTPLRCPIISLASPTIPYPIPYLPLPYPHLGSPPLPSSPYSSLNSPPLRYPTLSSHLLPFPIYPLLASASHPTPSLPHYLTLPSATLSHHSLPSPYPLTWRTLPCHLPSPTPPISSPFSSPLGYPILPSRPYPTILSPFLPFPRTPSAPLPYLSSHLLPSPPLPTLAFPTIRSARIPSSPFSSPTLLYPHHTYPLIAYHTYPLPYHIPLGGLGAKKSSSLPYSWPHFPALLCPPLPYAVLPSPNPFLPSTPRHFLSLPSPQLPSPDPLHYSTPHSFPYPLLPSPISPTIPSPPFIPQLTYPTLQSPPSLSSLPPPLPYAPLSTLLYSPAPTLLYSPLYYPSLVSPPLPTYLPSHPYHTLAFPTLRSPHIRPLASPPIPSPPLSSPTLACPLPYHVPPDSPAPTLLYSPIYYSSIASLHYLPTLAPLSYPCIPYPPLPSHPLPSHPLPCPLPYPTISLRTSLGAEAFPSLPL